MNPCAKKFHLQKRLAINILSTINVRRHAVPKAQFFHKIFGASLELYDLTTALIDLESPTGSERKIARFLQDYLEAAGFAVQLQEVKEGRSNIHACLGEPELVFSTHVDTVLPHFPARADRDFIHGRGACDAKGIIAAQIKAAERLRDAGIQSFGLLFVVGEESGSDGARAANTIPNRCRFLINGEPTENKLALGSKGALRVEVVTTGRAAHSAYPQQGESAIVKLLDVLNAVRGLRLPTHSLLGETTCNIGTIAGGIQANVIPDFAKAELMFRIVTDTGAIKSMLEEKVGGRAAIRYTFACEPVFMEALEGFETTVVAFTTDIPLLTNWGQPLLLGPGSILDAHTPHERIAKTELARAVEIYFQMAKKLLLKN
jgi:acetylornithine deacetylase